MGGAKIVRVHGSRRAWLAGRAPWPAPVGWSGRTKLRERRTQAIEALAKRSGSAPFRVSRTTNYLGIGDSVDVFRSRTLNDCEAVRADYMDYYRARGFDITEPAQPLTVVTLTDDRSFAAFLGKKEYALRPGKPGWRVGPRRVPAPHQSAGRLRSSLAG